ncbi:L,D-transpeptidase family protein [Ideonella benzenivorans]|uniref:L,D-transpeptidase family protein n=1 Tax=Ideonella benzenivorans TaxID=2831643 RepID=UPI002103FC70|nr:L,D-transpeptidase family protein [Ideonella benzenivorans]
MNRRDLMARALGGGALTWWSGPLAWAQTTGVDAAAGPAMAWLPDGRAGTLARQAVALLADADREGLDPQDYQAQALGNAVTRAERTALAPEAAAALSGRLSTAMRRYLDDLHRGRIDPRQLQQNYDLPARSHFDAAAALQQAAASGRLADAVQTAEPRAAIYAALRQTLADYRALGHPSAWQTPLPPLPASRQKGRPAKLEPGQDWAGLDLLRQRLQLLGDLDAQATTPAHYQSPLVEAVQAFQQRHGLNDDGVIGTGTLAALNVPPAARVRQIALTMERLRWTPFTEGARMIAINLPEFVLRGYEVKDGQITVKTEMKVIVGKALNTRTPIFDEDMRFIEFSPYWNIPPSIARKETVPKLRRDPGYLARQGMEFVAGDGQVLRSVSGANLDAVLAGRMRIRQRPGPENALGDIKFVFPNNDNIYLHHTPATALFERERRDFSHGCIRVEKPVELAKFVLQDMPDWTEERIVQAMTKGESSTLKLTHPIPVLIAYGTALVKHGRPYFFPDLYGQDKALDAALRNRRLP